MPIQARLWDATGYLATALVVLAFCMKDIVPLRIVALASNIAFFTYGIGLGLVPVCLLHAVLLPINCWRLWQGVVSRRQGATRDADQISTRRNANSASFNRSPSPGPSGR
jgi:hypothetical protein